MMASRLSPGSPPPVSGAPTYSMSTALPTSTFTITPMMWCATVPLCESHIEGEVLDPLSTLRKVEGVKAASYAHVLDGVRSAAAVSAGLRVIIYTTCSFTSLGALGMAMGTVKCLNAAAGYLKKRAVAVARTAPGGS